MLGENEVAAVIDLLGNADVFFEIGVIDMGMHSDDEIAAHKSRQEHGITSHLTEEHHENLRKQVIELRAQLAQMSNQLYIQSVLTFEVIAKVLRHSTIYFSQRLPRELAPFSWVIDAKDRSKATPWEEWWALVIMPMLQSKFLREPMGHLIDADYSHYDQRYKTIPNEYIKRMFKDPTAMEAIDLKKIISENFRFSPGSEPGLEIVDILTNAVRRAMIGNLQFDGYRGLPSLMIHRGSHYINLISLASENPRSSPSYMAVLNHFKHGGKNMLF